MIDLSGWLAIINLIVLVAGSFGVVLSFRSSMANAERAIQDRVIVALNEEREGLNRKIEEMKRDHERCNSVISTIRYVLKLRGLKITIDGDMVSLSESNGANSNVLRIADRSAQLDD